MDKFEKINKKLAKIESLLLKMRKNDDIDYGKLEEIESQLNEIFESLDAAEAELLLMDVRESGVKNKLIECANLVNSCDRLWKMTRTLGNDVQDEEIRDERDDLEMMFPDEDIDSDDFEVGDYQN